MDEIAEEIMVCSNIISLCGDEKRKRRKRKIWVKEWLKKRATNSHISLLSELKDASPDDYKNFLRMDSSVYEQLLELVTPFLQKEETMIRDDVLTPHQKLSTTLRFLATGQSYEDLKFLTRIAPQTIGKFTIEVCNAIIRVLHGKQVIHTPQSEEEWKEVARSFEKRWNFPHCIGAIDGKHIAITKPPGTGSYYFNYKKTFSIVLFAIANANYEFIMVDAGANGRVSDGGIQSNSKFFDMLENKKLQLPDPEELPKGNFGEMPYVIVGDDAFSLSENLMKPCKGTMTDEERIYSYRLSRARRIIENCFGILASRFRILLTTINLAPKKVERIVLACCYLHNYIIQNSRNSYLQGATDIEHINTGVIQEATWRTEPQQLIPLQSTLSRNPKKMLKQCKIHFANTLILLEPCLGNGKW